MTGRMLIAGVAAVAAVTGVAVGVGIAGVGTARGDAKDWTDSDAFADAEA